MTSWTGRILIQLRLSDQVFVVSSSKSEDAPVKVPEARTRKRRTPSHHGAAAEAITPVLMESRS
jgi:hypothetical protein